MKRIVVIDREKCRAPDKCDYICMRVCPIQKNNIPIFKIAEDKKPIVDESYCIGCGICVKKCPFNAIIVINLTKEPDVRPVFQYGPNYFRLYRLPYPKENSVVGIIGRNGMGKTTSIKILAGLLRPNLGKFDGASEKEILEFFRGSELQKYFAKLFKKEIKVSYKPQDIFVFVKLYGNRTVRELIEKVGINEKVIKRFNLENIIERKIKELSGGELQKVLVLLTSYKDANVYLFDEPTAYLDIFERLRIAIFLDNLKQKGSVLVIDHDLIFLDYLSDIVYIVYGVPKAYGVFSYPMGAREGINQYLEGFIKRENLRIRDKPIKLDVKPFSEKSSNELLVEWKNIYVKLNGFELRSEKGNIKKLEIVGVVGRNGIGKTTFAKVLAGLINYTGNLTRNVSIAYKPQYLELPEELKYFKVKDFLNKLNPAYKMEYKEYLTELGIADLLEHEIGTLSGGELQTVLTFGTLIQEKELYILDEPFAFLDVEQRLRMSKFIREIVKQKEKSCLIIEHDLLFLDYISDRILVFLGEPGKYGHTIGPLENKEALNIFLKEADITIRRDPETKRPRINKPGSYLDRMQKSMNMYYQDL